MENDQPGAPVITVQNAASYKISIAAVAAIERAPEPWGHHYTVCVHEKTLGGFDVLQAVSILSAGRTGSPLHIPYYTHDRDQALAVAGAVFAAQGGTVWVREHQNGNDNHGAAIVQLGPDVVWN